MRYSTFGEPGLAEEVTVLSAALAGRPVRALWAALQPLTRIRAEGWHERAEDLFATLRADIQA